MDAQRTRDQKQLANMRTARVREPYVGLKPLQTLSATWTSRAGFGSCVWRLRNTWTASSTAVAVKRTLQMNQRPPQDVMYDMRCAMSDIGSNSRDQARGRKSSYQRKAPNATAACSAPQTWLCPQLGTPIKFANAMNPANQNRAVTASTAKMVNLCPTCRASAS